MIKYTILLTIISSIYSSPTLSCIDHHVLTPSNQSLQFLESILSPIPIHDFITNYLNNKPVTAKRPNLPYYYGPLLSFDDVEVAIEKGHKSSSPNERIQYNIDWKLAKRVKRDGEWWTGVFANPDNRLSLASALQAVNKHGYTIIMNRAQSTLPNVFQAALRLEEALGWLVNVNLYVSPPGGAQGFEAHIDWMDGFIFQIAGTKRWKTYDPPLVAFPRPDLVIKPSVQFLEDSRNESLDISQLNPPVNEFSLLAGDMAYIPRGTVHEAYTSIEDITETNDEVRATDPYQQPAMHLTFGVETAKMYSLEVLLHHHIASHFESLAVRSANVQSSASVEFKSDSGRMSFVCSTGPHSTADEGGILSQSDGNPMSCHIRDIVHLYVMYVAGDTSEKQGSSHGSVVPYYTLRQSLGVTSITSSYADLDPRILFPKGKAAVNRGVQDLGLGGFFSFLMERGMISLTSVPTDTETVSDSLLGSLYRTLKSVTGGNGVLKSETLHDPGFKGHTTLGSDKSCSYVNKFLSNKFKVESSRALNIRVRVSQSVSGKSDSFRESQWKSLELVDAADAYLSKQFHRSKTEEMFGNETWTQAIRQLADLIAPIFGENVRNDDQDDRVEAVASADGLTDGTVATKIDSARTDGGLCSAFDRMMRDIKRDKTSRQKNGLKALRNAGHRV
eukprot:CAMPEP_0185036184 /NCGR_PEP_ID=MMETSP1103-20130426/28759_1 /TAXON_ID=36769 /ORGANISM="Paraphysomonas bandaiensis, Strain Caron Lab Isolate" /LENGTH=672 /DNA_ID=CAMNT_0027573617 /DNA_START=42 /DNA_END=2060 /DNA_ORIENTATION=+